MKLHHIIKQLREEQGLTQEVLAQRAELTRGYISRLEAGDYTDGSPTIKTLQKIAEGLAVPLELILNRAGITKEENIKPIHISEDIWFYPTDKDFEFVVWSTHNKIGNRQATQFTIPKRKLAKYFKTN